MKTIMLRLTTLGILWLLLCPNIFAGSEPLKAHLKVPFWKVDLNHGQGKIEFKAIGHPSALRILGKGAAPHGTFTLSRYNVNGIATFDLKSLDAGVKLRTHHLQEKYLQTDKYPEAHLKLTNLVLPQEVTQDHFELNQVPFTGMLSLHGVEKPISGFTQIKKQDHELTINAHFTIKISDYKIDVPSFMGITVADEVQVTVMETAPMTQED